MDLGKILSKLSCKFEIFSKLESFIHKIHIGSSKKYSFYFTNDLGQVDIQIKDDKVAINISKIDKSEALPALVNEMQKDLQKGDIFLLEDAQKQLDEFRKCEEKPETKDTVTYFRSLIPQEDLNVLRAAIYLNECFKQHQDISGLKNEIKLRYGKRGVNICHLYSQGYFTQLRELFDYFKSQETDIISAVRKFDKIYNFIVRLPFIIFVGQDKLKSRIKEEIIYKKNQLLKFNSNIKQLHIHAIKRDNVSKTKEAVYELLKEDTTLAIDTEINDGDTISIILKILDIEIQ